VEPGEGCPVAEEPRRPRPPRRGAELVEEVEEPVRPRGTVLAVSGHDDAAVADRGEDDVPALREGMVAGTAVTARRGGAGRAAGARARAPAAPADPSSSARRWAPRRGVTWDGMALYRSKRGYADPSHPMTTTTGVPGPTIAGADKWNPDCSARRRRRSRGVRSSEASHAPPSRSGALPARDRTWAPVESPPGPMAPGRGGGGPGGGGRAPGGPGVGSRDGRRRRGGSVSGAGGGAERASGVARRGEGEGSGGPRRAPGGVSGLPPAAPWRRGRGASARVGQGCGGGGGPVPGPVWGGGANAPRDPQTRPAAEGEAKGT